MSRIIIHSDLNNFFASVECLKKPWLKSAPMAVAGDTESRHGIILAKNAVAASFGVKTAEPIWKAKRKCPQLITVPPHYDDYVIISRKVRHIYEEYSNLIEAFGIDECWIDISDIARDFSEGERIADEIRDKISKQINITASCGVSFNKTFAKLGSDMKKPDATTVITDDDFREKIWELPVDRLLYVGRSTSASLINANIHTIGDIAQTDVKSLEMLFGKNGRALWLNANGKDDSPVINSSSSGVLKSVSNSVTLPRDISTDEDARIVLLSLCEKVSARMRRLGAKCHTVQLHVRDSELRSYERQIRLDVPARTVDSIFKAVYTLYLSNSTGMNIRSLGVCGCDLVYDDEAQLMITEDSERAYKLEQIDTIADSIRQKYGRAALTRGIMLTPSVMSGIDIHEDKSSFKTDTKGLTEKHDEKKRH